MIIAKIAAYIIAIVAILGLSVKFLWLFFILFTYRTISSFVTYDWFQQIGIDNHFIYFVVILVLSLVAYGLLLRYTVDLPWIKFVVLSLLMVWVLKNYSFQDVFLFKDYLQANGMWNIDWYVNQFKEIFTTGPEAFAELFMGIFRDAFGIFEKLISGVASVFR